MQLKSSVFWPLLSLSLLAGVYSTIDGTYSVGVITAGLCALLVYAHLRLRAPGWIELIGFAALLINTLGWAWDLYDVLEYFDKLSHFASSLATLLVIGLWMLARFPRYKWRQVMVSLFLIGFLMGGAWEVYEHFSDAFEKNDLVKGPMDTATDVLADTAGVLVAIYLLGFGKPRKISYLKNR